MLDVSFLWSAGFSRRVKAVSSGGSDQTRRLKPALRRLPRPLAGTQFNLRHPIHDSTLKIEFWGFGETEEMVEMLYRPR
jgi:hypothetical protein